MSVCPINYVVDFHCRNIRQEIGNYYPDPDSGMCLRTACSKQRPRPVIIKATYLCQKLFYLDSLAETQDTRFSNRFNDIHAIQNIESSNH